MLLGATAQLTTKPSGMWFFWLNIIVQMVFSSPLHHSLLSFHLFIYHIFSRFSWQPSAVVSSMMRRYFLVAAGKEVGQSWLVQPNLALLWEIFFSD
jgi:hypothetical protein